jgi:SAM-dependent methyltransferase
LRPQFNQKVYEAEFPESGDAWMEIGPFRFVENPNEDQGMLIYDESGVLYVPDLMRGHPFCSAAEDYFCYGDKPLKPHEDVVFGWKLSSLDSPHVVEQSLRFRGNLLQKKFIEETGIVTNPTPLAGILCGNHGTHWELNRPFDPNNLGVTSPRQRISGGGRDFTQERKFLRERVSDRLPWLFGDRGYGLYSPLDKKSALQATLQSEYMQRDLDTLFEQFDIVRDLGAEKSLWDAVLERRKTLMPGEPLVLLDGGCGAAVGLNQAVFSLGFLTEKGTQPVVGIGVDLNPAPMRTDPNCQIPFNWVERPIVEWKAFPNVQIMRGNVEELRGVDSGSVDVYWMAGVMSYVKDPLMALTEAFQVLKPGGYFAGAVYEDAMTEPGIEEIIERTPGAKEAFQVYRLDEGGRALLFVVIEKPQGDYEFEGFPYEFKDTEPAFPIIEKPQDEFMVRTTYKKES